MKVTVFTVAAMDSQIRVIQITWPSGRPHLLHR